MDLLKIIAASALLGANYLFVSLIISAFTFKKLRWQDLINTRIMILNSIFFMILFTLIFWVLFKLVVVPELPEIVISIVSFMFLVLIPAYEYFIVPYLILRNNEITEVPQKILHIKIPENIKVFVVEKEFTNAYAMGALPNSKTVIISKDLYNSMSKSEIGGVIAHEVGHLMKGHAFKLFLSTLFACFIGYVSTFYFYPLIDNSGYNIHVLRGIHGGFFYGLPLWLIPSVLQRIFEHQADKYAAKVTSEDNVISALEKLDNLSGGRVSKGGITHPPLKKRIDSINLLKEGK